MAQINKPNTYFNTLIWTGSDTASGRDFTGVGFQPDLVWAKTRSDANGHKWFDSVRGVGKSIQSESTGAETTNDGNGYIDSFDADGFSSVAGGTNNYNFNNTSTTFASWNWKAGGTASSNTDGSITSSVSANTTSGFSICTFDTGASTNISFGHGLGTAPSMVICKNRESAGSNWVVGHSGLGWTKWIKLNATDAALTSSDAWQDTAPTSSVVTSTTTLLGSNQDYVAYCFAEKKGFSKFGSYTSNGSQTFVYTGFKPAFILVKRTDITAGWYMFDNKRNTYNPTVNNIYPYLSDAENTFSNAYDLVSNGFVERAFFGSGANVIYMAFAENPLVGTNNIPACAR